MATSALIGRGSGWDQRLSAALFEFNLLPAKWAHPAWIEHFRTATAAPSGPLIARRPLFRASMRMLTDRGLADTLVTEIDHPVHLVALLDWETLDMLVMLTGCALLWKQICSTILCNEVWTLRREIGAQLQRFAINKGRFLVGPEPVITFTPQKGQNWKEQITLTGIACLGMAFSEASRALTGRLAMKLEPAKAQRINWTAAPDKRLRAINLIKKIAAEELECPWTQYWN